LDPIYKEHVVLSCDNRVFPKTFPSIGDRLKELGYATHFFGKWHLGFPTWDVTAEGRGFDTFYGFWSGAPDHWNHISNGALDLVNQREPQFNETGVYSSTLWTRKVLETIAQYDPSSGTPQYFHIMYNAPHTPLEAPPPNVAHCNHIADSARRTFCGMVNTVDESIQTIQHALVNKGMWSNTILIWCATWHAWNTILFSATYMITQAT
jgi:arylsulfatase B/arylsulfatase I/J